MDDAIPMGDSAAAVSKIDVITFMATGHVRNTLIALLPAGPQAVYSVDGVGHFTLTRERGDEAFAASLVAPRDTSYAIVADLSGMPLKKNAPDVLSNAVRSAIAAAVLPLYAYLLAGRSSDRFTEQLTQFRKFRTDMRRYLLTLVDSQYVNKKSGRLVQYVDYSVNAVYGLVISPECLKDLEAYAAPRAAAPYPVYTATQVQEVIASLGRTPNFGIQNKAAPVTAGPVDNSISEDDIQL